MISVTQAIATLQQIAREHGGDLPLCHEGGPDEFQVTEIRVEAAPLRVTLYGDRYEPSGRDIGAGTI